MATQDKDPGVTDPGKTASVEPETEAENVKEKIGDDSSQVDERAENVRATDRNDCIEINGKGMESDSGEQCNVQEEKGTEQPRVSEPVTQTEEPNTEKSEGTNSHNVPAEENFVSVDLHSPIQQSSTDSCSSSPFNTPEHHVQSSASDSSLTFSASDSNSESSHSSNPPPQCQDTVVVVTDSSQTEPLPSKLDCSLDETDRLMSELDMELQSVSTDDPIPNGVCKNLSLSEHKDLRLKFESLQQHLDTQKYECQKLTTEGERLRTQLAEVTKENKGYVDRLKHLESKGNEDIYAAQTKELERTIAQQQREIRETQDKLASHDAAAKRAIATLQGELKHRMEQAQKHVDDLRREKESMVMKYALAEQKNIEAADRVAKMEAHVRDVNREREQMLVKCRGMKADKDKAVEAYETKLNEVAALRREIDRQKDLVETQEVKTKWAQNKLKAEAESHKETKAKVEELQRRILQTKEEAEQIRRDCQAMIRTYQESEEVRSNSLDLQLKEKLSELEAQKQEKSDQKEVYESMRRELESLKQQHRDMLRDLKSYKDKMQCMDAERICQEQSMDKYRSTVAAQKAEISSMEARLTTLRDIEVLFKQEQEKATSLGDRVSELEQTNKDLTADMEGCAHRESEHLAFSEKISNMNAQLQSENTSLQNKLDAVCSELEKYISQNDELSEKVANLEKLYAEEKRLRSEETETLKKQLEEKTKLADELSVQVEDERDATRTLKRRHQANIKDLTRQLQQAKRRLEGVDPRSAGGAGSVGDSTSVGSMGSRASSTGSLEKTGQGANGSRESSQEPTPQMEDSPPIVEYVEVDKQMLMEKIVKLQRAHARKNDKLEFLEDHINQLLNEVQRKAKIIQHYAISQEPGALAPEAMDQHKMALSKKGGIMASVYSQHSQDGAMTLDLSLQINRKLQAVLEDILLKNITLKDNLDTLGQEIARLSQENRQLQLQLQGVKPRS